MNCRHCNTRVKKVGDYVPPTCGKSECQEAEFKANQERNKPKRRRLRPKEGALKADGTRWTSQPGGIMKLEIPVPSPTSNEYLFAKLINAVACYVNMDYETMESLAKNMGVDYETVADLIERAEDVVYRTEERHGKA